MYLSMWFRLHVCSMKKLWLTCLGNEVLVVLDPADCI